MKCIIITFHSEVNYGAVLQAYALQTYLKKNNSVKLLNIKMNKKERNIKAIIRNSFNIIKKSKFNKFLKRNFDLTKKVNTFDKSQAILKEFDYAIVGSDQVWAFDLIKGFERIFFMDMKFDKTKKVSYAASFGKDDNIINNKEIVTNYLNGFDKISTREESSRKILNEMGIQCDDVVDPTLLLSSNEYVEKFNLKKKEKKYILVYMLVIDEEIVRIVNEINKELDMDIICFNNKNRFGNRCKCVPNSSPEEFVELFYNASFVVTNSFHGTCFSIIFEKKFISVAHKTKGIRQINLLKKAGLEERLYTENKDIKKYIQDDVKAKEEFWNYIDLSKKFLDELK